MSRLTIIIPFFSDTRVDAFEETLASVLVHRPNDTEIIVANGTDYADPWDVDNEGVLFVSLAHRSNPIDILNDAIRLAKGSIVHLLYPGTEVSEDWANQAICLFDDPEVGFVIPTVYDRRKPKRIFSFGVQYFPGGTLRTIRRSRMSDALPKNIAPHISAFFLRKSALQRIGGFNRSFLPQISFLDAAFCLSELNWKTATDQVGRILVRPNLLPAPVPFSYGFQLERFYFRWLGRHLSAWILVEHIGAVAVEFWRHCPRLKSLKTLAGRFCGLIHCGEAPLLARQIGRYRQSSAEADSAESDLASSVLDYASFERSSSNALSDGMKKIA